MPLYEYKCDACGHRFEVIKKYSDPPLEICPKCGGAVHKLQSAPAFQFKGTGWYVTDYPKKDQTPAPKEDSGSSSSKDASETKDPAKGEQSGKNDKSDKTDKSDKRDRGGKSEKSAKSEKTETTSEKREKREKREKTKTTSSSKDE